MAWKIGQSERVEQVICAPGNPGTAAFAVNHDVAADDIAGLLALAQKEGADLTVVGPEVPLTMGIVDEFQKAGLRCWGPCKQAAELEGSKVVMKEFLRRYNIPTASFKIFDDAQRAHEYIDQIGAPIVIKCDGLAAGKGVTVAQTDEEAHEAIKNVMEDHVFGAEAGSHVIIEETLHGEEISIFALCDGHNALLLDAAQDHKQAFDGDKGPNTGGMGAFTPAPHLLSAANEDEVVRRVLVPTLNGLVREGAPYVGVLYMGLMLTETGPKVIEYNVRFGDPECQPLMLRLKSDLVELIEASLDGKLDQHELQWDKRTAMCVTMASGGYPGSYEKGKVISGIEDAEDNEAVVFHAGTSTNADDEVVTAGGRVLSVCALGDDLDSARTAAYEAVGKISFADAHYRNDIGCRHG